MNSDDPADLPLPATLPDGQSPPPAASAGPAEMQLEHYHILTREDQSAWELGRGAMGVTYKALDTRLRLHVALKVISADLLARHPAARERFLREARAAARLRHPSVASVFHLGETAAGQAFYAMEFIEGETLEARVRRRGPLSVGGALEVGIEVTRALVAASQQGLIHRDLKPANLMLVAGTDEAAEAHPGSSHHSEAGEARVKVIDFGLAKAAADAGPLTGAGDFLGTPHFASPEQFGDGENGVDARSDIYSLGVTLWFALTGKLPFPGRSPSEVRSRQLSQPLPTTQLSAAHVPAPLAAVLASMLAADPADRPQTPHALLDALRRCRASPVTPGNAPAAPAAVPVAPAPARLPLVLAGLVALAVLLGGGTFFLLKPPPGKTPPAPAAAAPDKSIAVLPLENLSDDKDNAYFADGIQDDVLASLAKIKDLKVISRASVSAYKANLPRDLHEIGAQLGVAHVLIGSVRRAGNRVLVNAALVNIRDGRQLWAERYDRTLADSLTLQGELATEIAATLRANLSPAEKARVEEKPTGNPEAYALYLRARDYENRSAVDQLQDLLTAEGLYGQAVALDPGFALGHARLSLILSRIHSSFQPTEARKAQARAEAEEALRLRPDLGEAHLALGEWLVLMERDYGHALKECDLAARTLPNDVGVRSLAAGIHHGQGLYGVALAELEQVLTLDPLNARLAGRIAFIYWALRDWPAAAAAFDHTVSLAPDQLFPRIMRAYVDWSWKADAAPLKALLATVPPGLDPDGIVTYARWDINLATRDFAAAERAVAACSLDPLPMFQGTPLPKAYLAGSIALAQGQAERAHSLFEVARVSFEAGMQASPQAAQRHADLGVLYAYLGRKEDALREGRRAAELAPESKDAAEGPYVSACLALIYARIGGPDQAIPLIQRLLATPNADFGESGITLTDLRQRWQWDPLRGDPRFQKILAGPEPETPRTAQPMPGP